MFNDEQRRNSTPLRMFTQRISNPKDFQFKTFSKKFICENDDVQFSSNVIQAILPSSENIQRSSDKGDLLPLRSGHHHSDLENVMDMLKLIVTSYLVIFMILATNTLFRLFFL